MNRRLIDREHFRMFLAGESPNAVQAIVNRRVLDGEYLTDRRERERDIENSELASTRAVVEYVLLTPARILGGRQ